MEQENNNKVSIQEQLNEQQQALVKIYQSVEKTRKYMLWTGIMSITFLIIPLVVVIVMLPKIIASFTEISDTFLGAGFSYQNAEQPSFEESFRYLEGLF